MTPEEIDKLKKAAKMINSHYVFADVRQYAEILRQAKPSVYLLHGYYPGGRNNP